MRQLEGDFDHAVATGELDPADLPPLPAGLKTGARPMSSEGSARLFFTAPRDVARLFHAVLAAVQRRIERACGRPSSHCEAFEAILDHAFEAWGRAPGRLRFALGLPQGRPPLVAYASGDFALSGGSAMMV